MARRRSSRSSGQKSHSLDNLKAIREKNLATPNKKAPSSPKAPAAGPTRHQKAAATRKANREAKIAATKARRSEGAKKAHATRKANAAVAAKSQLPATYAKMKPEQKTKALVAANARGKDQYVKKADQHNVPVAKLDHNKAVGRAEAIHTAMMKKADAAPAGTKEQRHLMHKARGFKEKHLDPLQKPAQTPQVAVHGAAIETHNKALDGRGSADLTKRTSAAHAKALAAHAQAQQAHALGDRDAAKLTQKAEAASARATKLDTDPYNRAPKAKAEPKQEPFEEHSRKFTAAADGLKTVKAESRGELSPGALHKVNKYIAINDDFKEVGIVGVRPQKGGDPRHLVFVDKNDKPVGSWKGNEIASMAQKGDLHGVIRDAKARNGHTAQQDGMNPYKDRPDSSPARQRWDAANNAKVDAPGPSKTPEVQTSGHGVTAKPDVAKMRAIMDLKEKPKDATEFLSAISWTLRGGR